LSAAHALLAVPSPPTTAKKSAVTAWGSWRNSRISRGLIDFKTPPMNSEMHEKAALLKYLFFNTQVRHLRGNSDTNAWHLVLPQVAHPLTHNGPMP
jgi:hypothetical protein